MSGLAKYRDPIFDGLDNDLSDACTTAPEGDFRGRLADAVAVLRFVRAGKATITLRSAKPGTRFT
jgi:hypothetical protein